MSLHKACHQNQSTHEVERLVSGGARGAILQELSSIIKQKLQLVPTDCLNELALGRFFLGGKLVSVDPLQAHVTEQGLQSLHDKSWAVCTRKGRSEKDLWVPSNER